jgi:tetratricopeptide (TPR) repeat protein
MLDRWLTQGEVSLAVVIIPQIVLLINLLAAGAVVFPGVISTLLVLAPVALFVASGSGVATKTAAPMHLPLQFGLSWTAAGIVTLAASLVAMACLYTEYYPVLNGRLALAEALYRLDQRQYREAEPKAIEAVKADSLSPEPLRLLAELKLARWQATGRPKDREDFVQVASAFTKLDPRHHLAWYTRGTWYLTAWRKSENREDLEAAISAYRQAVKRYPNRALYHAQLAWVLHLAGQAAEAGQEAEKALALDRKMPHREQKLNRQHVVDPVVSQERTTAFREENAEQTAERLRNSVAEENP